MCGEPGLWQAHYSLGAAMLATCRCRGAISAYARALSALREQGGSAAHEAAVLKAQATGALPVAKVATNSTRQLELLEFAASSLERAFAVMPEPLSPLYDAVVRARGRGGLHHLLLVSSGGECVTLLRAQAAAATLQGRLGDAVLLGNRARQLDPDSPENFRLLREAIQAEAAATAGAKLPRTPLLLAATAAPDALISFSQNGQDRWIFEEVLRMLLPLAAFQMRVMEAVLRMLLPLEALQMRVILTQCAHRTRKSQVMMMLPNPQPSTLNPQPSTLNRKPSTLNPKP
jgi:hypothetical protein